MLWPFDVFDIQQYSNSQPWFYLPWRVLQQLRCKHTVKVEG